MLAAMALMSRATISVATRYVKMLERHGNYALGECRPVTRYLQARCYDFAACRISRLYDAADAAFLAAFLRWLLMFCCLLPIDITYAATSPLTRIC